MKRNENNAEKKKKMLLKSEVGDQKSEVGSRMSDFQPPTSDLRNPIKVFVFFIFLFSIFFSCKQKEEKHPIIIEKKPDRVSLNDQVRVQLQAILNEFLSDSITEITKDTIFTSAWIYEAFEQNNFFPFWTKDSATIPAADTLLAIIDTANKFGLIPSDYHRSILNSHLDDIVIKSFDNKATVLKICEMNILLTDAFFRLLVDLNKGRLDPDSLNRVWKGNQKDSSCVILLNKAIRQRKLQQTILDAEPSFEKYHKLKKYLSTIRDSGELKKVIVNLERLRWEKELYEDYYISINIPSYRMKYFACDTLMLTSKVIVGKPETPSPARLNSKVVYFYAYPYWMVPLSIATKEILPNLQKDTGYLARHNMDLLDGHNNLLDPAKIKWSKYSEDYFPYKIRQRDGDDNTLGILKFIFPNKMDIYLHDTNARGLFGKQKRSLSHGCIRVEKARQLAKQLLSCCALNYNSDSLNNDLKNKTRKRVDLFIRVPIHIRYNTCEVDSGRIRFYEDIYKLDSTMLGNLNRD